MPEPIKTHLYSEKRPRRGQKCLVLMKNGDVVHACHDCEFRHYFRDAYGCGIESTPIKWIDAKKAFKLLFVS